MSTWTAPITWTASSTLTAAQMNAEIRDHLNFLKGFADLISASTTADTGTATYLNIVRPAGTDNVLRGSITGDSNFRFVLSANGLLSWGPGNASVDMQLSRTGTAQLIYQDTLGTDTTVFFNNGQVVTRRSAAASTAFASAASITQTSLYPFVITADGGQSWGDGASARDTTLYRSAANVLKTDDQLVAVDGVTTRVVAGVVSDGSFTATPGSGTIAIDTTNSKIYVRVGATWKSVTVA